MVKVKKIKKWSLSTRRNAERAEAAATRAEAALIAIRQLAGEPPSQRTKDKKKQPVYTGPRGHDALAPAATVS